MKITDCVIRTRTIVAGVLFCILFAVLFSFLSRPLKASAQGNAPVTLETGVNRADDTMAGKALAVPEGDVTLDLNGKDLTVLSVSGSGASFTLTGKGSLTVSDFLRLSDSTVILEPDKNAAVTINGGVYCRNSKLVFRNGDFFCDGKYVHADTIRIEGGNITIDAAKDGLRADSAFVMTDGSVDSTGGTHGLHLEGSAELTGGTLKLAGRDGAWHASHEDLVPEELLDLAAADTLVLGAQTAAKAGKPVQTTANANAAASASRQTQTTANAAASVSRQTQTTTNANAAASASRQTQTTASANANATANAAASASRQAQTTANAADTASTTAADTAADTATTTAADTATSSASAAETASTSDTEASALPVSASGSASSGSSSASAANVKSVQVPAMSDNGMLFYGFALLTLAISGFAVISGRGYYHEADKKRRP